VKAIVKALIWIGSAVLAFVGLMLVNLLVHSIAGDASIDLTVAVLVALALYAVLFKLISGFLHHPAPWWVALIFAVAFVVGLPAAIVWRSHSDGPKIRAQVPIQGRIDLVLVAPGPLPGVGTRPSAPPGDLAPWDVRYTVVTPSAQGKGLDVLVAGTESRGLALRALHTGEPLEPGAGRVEWRPEAQRAAVLDVSAGPGSDPLVPAAAALRAPHFALLTGSTTAPLEEWAAWSQQRGGEAGTVGELEGPTLIDAALRLVATNQGALADRQLAYAYRPLLFFDKREVYDWPVDIDAAFGEEAVAMCEHAVPDDACETLKRASDLDQSFDYLRVDPRRFSATDRERSKHVVGSAYYYHAVHGKQGQTYLDYWWYLPYNPSLSAWMCSPGFSLPNFDCFDHESDWEGVTVEVGPEGGPPLAVYYAQHANVARHEWPELLDGWRELPQGEMVERTGSYHPLVFVARASHASYRNPCQTHACVQYGSVLPEGNHNGGGKWPDDDDTICAGRCLRSLPVSRDDRPATWNAFSGPWGTQECILYGTFCNRAEAPQSPAFQWRYDHVGVAR
jgi:hypothetical protein